MTLQPQNTEAHVDGEAIEFKESNSFTVVKSVR